MTKQDNNTIIKRNFDPEKEFFVIDSENLECVKTKLYGYCIQNDMLVEHQEDLDGERVTGEGAYVWSCQYLCRNRVGRRGRSTQ